jgi:hypothetical protein
MTSSEPKFRTKVLGALSLVTALAISLFSSAPAFALGTLDQQATGTSTNWYYNMNNFSLGQVFTAGATGQLDRATIDVLSFQGATTAPLVVNVFAVDGSGFPTGTSLASASVPQTSIPATISTVAFDFSTPASIQSGAAYALVFTTSGSGDYHFENATTVPAGAKGIKPGSGNVGWQNYVDTGVTPNQTSFRFATYVTPSSTPSPSVTEDPTLARTGAETSQALLLLGVGAFLLIAGGVITNTVRAQARRK